jgi:hypothetical protein
MLPLVDQTIPDGQGLVDLALFQHTGGGRIQLYSVAAGLFYALGLIWYAAKYPQIKRAWLPIVAATFFFATRSFASYLFMLVPAAIVAATSVRPVQKHALGRWSRHTQALGVAMAIVLAAVLALAIWTPAPLVVKVVQARSTGQLQTIQEITVAVTNTTNQVRTPHFTINSANHVTTFWYPFSGGRTDDDTGIAPHQTRTFTLRAPNSASTPRVGTPLIVDAFTTGPAAISTSNRYLVSPLRTRIIPDAVNAPVPVGRRIALEVQLEDRYGRPVHRSGVTVLLGQTIYAETAVIPAESSINGAAEGASPVAAITDDLGLATFTVEGVQPQKLPVYYEAWLPGEHRSVPHGYSNQVSIQYVSSEAQSG